MIASLCLLGLTAVGAVAQPVVVLDARSLSWESRCTAEVLQGLANREGPRVYLDFGQPWSKQWEDIYTQRNGLTFEPCVSLGELIGRFQGCFDGLVAYDPDIDGSRYAAITMGGTDRLLPVCPALLSGTSPELSSGVENWPGVNFAAAGTDLSAWNRGGETVLEHAEGGAWLYERDPARGRDWTMATLGPLTVDIGQFPVLEARVGALEGDGALWGIKLTWDRNADGQISGAEDDLSLDFLAEAGTRCWDVAKLAGLSGKQVFSRVQIHVAGKGARALFERLQFVTPDGASPKALPVRTLTEITGKPLVMDLRGKFPNSLAAYEWALQELMPKCDRRFAHAVNGREGDMQIGCGPFPGFDWTALHRAFVFNLTPSPEVQESYGGSKVGGSPEQAAMYRKILAALQPPAMITGYGEPEGYWCDLYSSYGHFSMHAYDNWSLHSKVPPRAKELRQKVAWRPENVTPEPDKYYVCVMTSEGDTMKGPIPFFYGSWSDPRRGSVAMNWGINPLMGEYFPAMLEYFYDTATPQDFFFAGCSGAGYTYPDKTPNLAQFAQQSADACRTADVPVIDMWGAGKAEVQEEYARIASPLGLTINSTPARMRLLPDGTPAAFHQLAYWQTSAVGADKSWPTEFRDPAKRAKALDWLAGQVDTISRTHYPPFIIMVYPDLHSWDEHATLAAQLQERLDPARFKVARLDEAFAAWRKWAEGQLLVSDGNDLGRRLVWTVFDEAPTQAPLSLTNAGPDRVNARVSLTAGAQAKTREVTLDPRETRVLRDFEVSGAQLATARTAQVSAEGPAGTVQREIELAVAPVPEALRGKAVALLNTWQVASLSRVVGDPVDDADALFGRAMRTPAPSGKWDTFTYGPYADMPAGRYAVAFRLRLAEPLGAADPAATVVTLDVACGGWDGTGAKVAERIVAARDLPADGSYGWVVLEGDWPGAPNLMETRSFWHGKVACVIDRIAAFRVVD